MFKSLLLQIGTYLVETFVGKSAIKDGGTQLENVKNAIEAKINDVKKTTEIGNIKNTLAEIVNIDDETVRSEKIDEVVKQIDEISLVQQSKIETANDNGIFDKSLKFISEIGFLRLGFAVIFITLMVSPSCIKQNIKDSELGRVFRSSLSTISENLSNFEFNGMKIRFAKNEFGALKSELLRIKNEVGKIGNIELADQIQNVIDRLDTTQKEMQTTDDTKNINSQKIGWVYLGKTNDKKNLLPDGITVAQPDLQKLKINVQVSLIDSVYLRAETEECKRTKGDIITAIPAGETVTLLNDPNICPTTNTVWVKIKRN